MRAVGGEALVIGERLFRAIEAGDLAAVRGLYSPHVRVWHNDDGKEQGLEENLSVLAWVVRHVRDLRYTEERRQRCEQGFVQQHVLRGRTLSGEDLAIPSCLVVRIEQGRIVRIDEYLDPASLEPLRRALTREGRSARDSSADGAAEA
jgi:ketosteroid isomerase-like protein